MGAGLEFKCAHGAILNPKFPIIVTIDLVLITALHTLEVH